MAVAVRLTLTAIMVASVMQAADGGHGTDIVARVGNRAIMRREIACGLPSGVVETEVSRAKLDELCMAREQKHLEFLIAQELYDAAIRKFAIEVSGEDLAADAAFHQYGEAEFVRLSDQYRRLGRAALLVYGGEDVHAVYIREVHATGAQSEEQFRRFVTLLRSAQGAERFVEYQTPERFREQITADARRRVAREKLMRILAEQARRNSRPYSDYSDEFWCELATHLGVEIVDLRYKPMSLKGLSWQPK